jgi:hypothetical protein
MPHDIEEFRFHFDAMYVGGIPRLLNEDGAFLAFLAVLTATEALAGVFAPQLGTGERFRNFVARFFPAPLGDRAEELWRFRNLMVHAFNPGPFVLVCHQSRLHLTPQSGLIILNAEDFYAALIAASHGYFDALSRDGDLQHLFTRRLADEDGGGMQSFTVQRTKAIDGAA